ncbi:MAG: hypothetical protein PHZ19_02150 [Candidatus Thermoplasmatota archaeon]|nr:hypothetical protein [Candidatus Thermoplasmatota archaeon]
MDDTKVDPEAKAAQDAQKIRNGTPPLEKGTSLNPFPKEAEKPEDFFRRLMEYHEVGDKFITRYCKKIAKTGELPDPHILGADLKSIKDSGYSDNRSIEFVVTDYADELKMYLERAAEANLPIGISYRAINPLANIPSIPTYPPYQNYPSATPGYPTVQHAYPPGPSQSPDSNIIELVKLLFTQQQASNNGSNDDIKTLRRELADLKEELVQKTKEDAQTRMINNLQAKLEKMEEQRQKQLEEQIKDLKGKLEDQGMRPDRIQQMIQDALHLKQEQLTPEKIRRIVEGVMRDRPPGRLTEMDVERERIDKNYQLELAKLRAEDDKWKRIGEGLQEGLGLVGTMLYANIQGEGGETEQVTGIQQGNIFALECRNCGSPIYAPAGQEKVLCPTCGVELKILGTTPQPTPPMQPVPYIPPDDDGYGDEDYEDEGHPSEPAEGDHICPVCGRDCGSRIGLYSHMQTHDEGDNAG